MNGKPKIIDPCLTIKNGDLGLHDTIAPNEVEIDFDHIKVNNVYYRTLFVAGYPRFVAPGWLEPIVNFNSSLDMSFYIYPVEGKSVLDDLRRKIAEMEAEISTDIERGRIVDPGTQAKLEDARALQEQLVKGIERYYEFSFYITIPANSLEELNHISRQIESTLGSLLVVAKHAMLDQRLGFLSTAPYGQDRLAITRNMDTTSVATTFPFTSAELSSDTGVLYGINSQNESFIIFDRFSLENGNMTVFATSGAGKCTNFSTQIVYKDKSGNVYKNKIGNVVNNIINNSTSIKTDGESEYCPDTNLKIYSFDSNLKGKWSNVQAVSRKKSPKTLVEIKTKSGRQITVTDDHSIVVLENGKLTTIKGDRLSLKQFIPLTREISIEKQVKKNISVREYLSNINEYTILKDRIGSHRYIKKTSLPLRIPASNDFYKVLGLFVAEGTVLPKQSHITNSDSDVLSLVEQYYKKLGVTYYFGKKKGKVVDISTGTRVFCDFLINIGLKGKAEDKKVPNIIFDSSLSQMSSFLKAYFEGDGTVDKHEITATTKSKDLASDLLYLLSFFGIIARTRTLKKRATNVTGSRKRTYYNVIISGQDNIRKYIDQIGFISERKNKKARKLLKSENTNIDVVPELENIFKEIREELYSSSEIPAPKKFSEIMLGIFKPSRKELLNIIGQIKERIYEIESLEKDGLSKLIALPTIQQIIDRSKNKKINTQLWKVLNHSWKTMRDGITPYTQNTLKAARITHGYEVEIDELGRSLYRCFKFTGTSLRKFDESLWSTVLYKKANARYDKILKAKDYIANIYAKKKTALEKIKEKVEWLEILARSDLFWDPIVKIKKIKSKYKYVYDLQVENSVFLAGYGGMFVHNSYFVKTEAVRSLMIGSEAIILDPEAEYKALCEAVGGEYISFSFNSPAKINPFDLSQIREEGENQLGLKILSLHSLFKVIMGTITPTQEAMLDRALIMTYKAKGITTDPATQSKEPPLIEDLYKTLIGMEVPDALDLAARIEKFVRGSFQGIFDKQTNINLNNPFTVFSVKDLQDALRPIAMFIILDYIWTRVKRDIKRRILIVDEAWHMMKYPDTAQFLWSVVKRARKYYLGLTTITQDVEDFLNQDIGKAIVTNSALRLLLKQSPAAIDKVGETFYLSQGEKQLLLAANVGEGIFFAGPHHAPIRVVASEEEHKLISTKPQEQPTQTMPNLKTWNREA